LIIAIDGPAGSGKSTIARLVAARLGLDYLDTGAMYRCVALQALDEGVDLLDGRTLSALAGSIKIDFVSGATSLSSEASLQRARVHLNGRDVTEEIRTPRIDQAVSAVARVPEVRAAMVSRQQEFGVRGDLVAEGRDTGTVVFPQAQVKIFLTASPEVRAARRHAELAEKGEHVTSAVISENMNSRDQADSSRAVGPLTAASDAHVIDTSALSIDDVVARVVAIAGKLR